MKVALVICNIWRRGAQISKRKKEKSTCSWFFVHYWVCSNWKAASAALSPLPAKTSIKIWDMERQKMGKFTDECGLKWMNDLGLIGGGNTDLGFIWKGPGSFEYKSVENKENSQRDLKVFISQRLILLNFKDFKDIIWEDEQGVYNQWIVGSPRNIWIGGIQFNQCTMC